MRAAAGENASKVAYFECCIFVIYPVIMQGKGDTSKACSLAAEKTQRK